jgi:catechol 2,3-dioxygenase-like lactoylglutathione lyase family enzyme
LKRFIALAAFSATSFGIVLLALHSTAIGRPSSAPIATPVLVNSCLITGDVKRLANFYARVLGIQPQRAGKDYVEFRTSRGVLALFAADAQEKYIPGSARSGENHSVILEFEVGDVDHEYARLQDLVKTWVKGPSTQPWGTRSIYFRDPDGNLVDFFTVVKASQKSN